MNATSKNTAGAGWHHNTPSARRLCHEVSYSPREGRRGSGSGTSKRPPDATPAGTVRSCPGPSSARARVGASRGRRPPALKRQRSAASAAPRRRRTVTRRRRHRRALKRPRRGRAPSIGRFRRVEPCAPYASCARPHEVDRSPSRATSMRASTAVQTTRPSRTHRSQWAAPSADEGPVLEVAVASEATRRRARDDRGASRSCAGRGVGARRTARGANTGPRRVQDARAPDEPAAVGNLNHIIDSGPKASGAAARGTVHKGPEQCGSLARGRRPGPRRRRRSRLARKVEAICSVVGREPHRGRASRWPSVLPAASVPARDRRRGKAPWSAAVAAQQLRAVARLDERRQRRLRRLWARRLYSALPSTRSRRSSAVAAAAWRAALAFFRAGDRAPRRR